MHTNNRKFLDDLKKEYPGNFENCAILELGSFAVSGDTIRPWFDSLDYVGIDTTPGPTVDIVIDAKDFKWSDDALFDTVVCFSMLEHDLHWRESLRNSLRYLKKGGMLFMCWGAEGNQPHMDIWALVPHQEVIDFLKENNFEIIDAFFEEDRYGKDCAGAFDLIAKK